MKASSGQKVAAIHDLSGFGRSSLTAVIPILSTMGIQVCPLPTAVLSSQTTGVSDFTFFDLTEQMNPVLDHWQRLGLRFDAVYSGFLGNPTQVEVVARCIREFKTADGLAIVDPVLGDNGQLDPTQTGEMVERMRWLAGQADILTPNLTEAAFLLGEPYNPSISPAGLKEQLRSLAGLGPCQVIITSAPASFEGGTATVAYDRSTDLFWRIQGTHIPVYYPGTGDMFASVLTGCILRGDSLPVAMEQAARFVLLCIRATCGHNLPSVGGVLLEKALGTLSLPYFGGDFSTF